jgi:hypothetical protein
VKASLEGYGTGEVANSQVEAILTNGLQQRHWAMRQAHFRIST